jgi:uncharacterized protein YycO
MNIQAGDIILVRGSHPIVSPLIRWFTNSEYTHVGIAINADLIYEIDIFKRMAIHPMKHENFDVFRYKNGLTKEQKKIMQNYAIKKAKENEGYDWLRIIAFALEKFFAYPIALDRANREVCSEIVDEIYMAAGIDLVPNRKTGHVRPADLAASPQLMKVYSSIEKSTDSNRFLA